MTLFAEAGDQRRHIFSLSHLALALDRAGEPEEARRRTKRRCPWRRRSTIASLLAMALNN